MLQHMCDGGDRVCHFCDTPWPSPKALAAHLREGKCQLRQISGGQVDVEDLQQDPVQHLKFEGRYTRAREKLLVASAAWHVQDNVPHRTIDSILETFREIFGEVT
jgi:hypothetical protein